MKELPVMPANELKAFSVQADEYAVAKVIRDLLAELEVKDKRIAELCAQMGEINFPDNVESTSC